MPNPSSADDLPASLLTHLECSICGTRHSADELQTICRSCGRALFARYDLEKARTTLTRANLAGRVASMWRYAEVMPASEFAGRVSLGEGMTPLLRAPRLGAALGCPAVFVKDEGGNPTGSFKARGIAAAMAKAVALGVTDVGMPTAGNAGSAAAAYAARAGIRAHVAMPKDAPQPIIDEVRAFGASLELVDGLISDAGHWIAAKCRELGWFEMSTLKEPYRAEGKKTLGYELWEQFDGELPDSILYPTGGGTGLIGMWKAFEELEAMGHIGAQRPKMFAIQSEGCAPIVRAWDCNESRADPWEGADTLAPGIRVPSPFADDLILSSLRESGGAAVAVTDEAIVAGMHEFAREEGIDACPEGGATLAALPGLLESGRIGRGERIVLFNTGTGLKHPELRAQ